MPLKTATIENVYIKSALETMPEVLEAFRKRYPQQFAQRASYHFHTTRHCAGCTALHTLLPWAAACCWAEAARLRAPTAQKAQMSMAAP